MSSSPLRCELADDLWNETLKTLRALGHIAIECHLHAIVPADTRTARLVRRYALLMEYSALVLGSSR